MPVSIAVKVRTDVTVLNTVTARRAQPAVPEPAALTTRLNGFVTAAMADRPRIGVRKLWRLISAAFRGEEIEI